jgi:hypothetical protein
MVNNGMYALSPAEVDSPKAIERLRNACTAPTLPSFPPLSSERLQDDYINKVERVQLAQADLWTGVRTSGARLLLGEPSTGWRVGARPISRPPRLFTAGRIRLSELLSKPQARMLGTVDKRGR